MKRLFITVIFTTAALVPAVASAQVYQTRTPPPPAAAEYQPWQFNDEAIFVNGVVYYPTRGSRFFDGEIMSQVAVYRRVPVYADVTLEPHSVIYVPIGRNLMRGYERRREGELAGTTGSRTPAFPVDVASPSTVEPRDTEPAPFVDATAVPPPMPLREIATSPVERENIPSSRTHVESIPQPRGNDGVWLEYAGSRWYSDGAATTFDADRFVEIGNYRGFGVYRDKNRGAEEIWVRVTADGPVAPYAKRR